VRCGTASFDKFMAGTMQLSLRVKTVVELNSTDLHAVLVASCSEMNL
jgi:hypothetical protein